MLSPREADEMLRASRNVPVLEGSIDHLKAVRASCLEAGIAAALVRPPRRGGG